MRNISDSELIENASTICVVVMIIMCMCGVVGNSLSLYVYWTPTFRKRSINLLLAALSASDLFLCLLAMPVFSITQIQSFLPGKYFNIFIDRFVSWILRILWSNMIFKSDIFNDEIWCKFQSNKCKFANPIKKNYFFFLIVDSVLLKVRG